MWHASVAVWSARLSTGWSDGPIPSSRVHPDCRTAALDYCKFMLRGVGQLPSALQRNRIAFHYRRDLTDQEIAGLDKDWCAIPATVRGGDFIETIAENI